MSPTTSDTLRTNARAISAASARIKLLQNAMHHEFIRFVQQPDEPESLFSFYQQFFDNADVCEFARFCRLTAAKKTDVPLITRLLHNHSETDENADNLRVAYLRSPIADRAFTLFSAEIGRLSAQYLPSFSAVCEEVLYNRCRYCILPLWHSVDGFLSSFHHMIEKHDLKISFVADVSLSDSEPVTRCALLCRSLSFAVPVNGYFQTTVTLPDDLSTGRFLMACEETGAAIEFTHTIPLTYATDQSALTVCFRITEECTAPLLLFLSAVLKSHTAEGLYTRVNDRRDPFILSRKKKP